MSFEITELKNTIVRQAGEITEQKGSIAYWIKGYSELEDKNKKDKKKFNKELSEKIEVCATLRGASSSDKLTIEKLDEMLTSISREINIDQTQEGRIYGIKLILSSHSLHIENIEVGDVQ